MTQYDLFAAGDGSAAEPADAAAHTITDADRVARVESTGSPAGDNRTDVDRALDGKHAAQWAATSEERGAAVPLGPNRQSADRQQRREGDDGRETIVIDPTSVGLPANARSRLAGDVVVCTTPPENFAEAVRLLAASGTLTEARIKALAADVAWIEKRRPRQRDGSTPSPLPCDPEALRPILAKIRPGQHKISRKRWYNIRGSLASIQRKTGWLPPNKAREPITTASWALVLGLVSNEAARGALRGFAVFCEARGIAPEAVTFADFEAYGATLRKTKVKDPCQTADTARYRWNGLARTHADFPGREVSNKPHHRSFRDPDHGIPASFNQDLDAYLAKLRKPGPFAPGFPRPAAEATIRSRGSTFAGAPHRLVRLGWDAASFTSLRSILTPEAVEALLTAFWETNCSEKEEWTLGAETIAQALKTAARQWGQLSAEDLQRVEESCGQVKARHRGFTQKKLERLAQFDDPQVERRFLCLPETLWKKATKLAKKGRLKRAAEIAKYALAIAILFDKPLRAADLAILDLALDFARDAKGRITGVRIGAGRASKRAPVVEGALSQDTRRKLDAFVAKYRPKLVRNETTALFPGFKTQHNKPDSMANQIRKTIARELGLDVNCHLFRAYIGTLILDEDPRATALAQRVLGHQHESTTHRFYAAQRGRAANRHYAEVIERRRRRLRGL